MKLLGLQFKHSTVTNNIADPAIAAALQGAALQQAVAGRAMYLANGTLQHAPVANPQLAAVLASRAGECELPFY